MSVVTETSANPYVGPRPFEPNEPIFGRDYETAEILDLLIAERIVLLYSPSGAGKTSLINAALTPALKRKGFGVLPLVRVSKEPPKSMIDQKPANRFVLSSLHSLEGTLSEETPSIDKRVSSQDLAGTQLIDYLDSRTFALNGPDRLVLIFDQFEEILTVDPANTAAKNAFFVQLGAVLLDHRYWVLFSVREDFIGGLDPYVRSIPTRFKNTFRLDLLDTESALLAIQEPPKLIGGVFDEKAAKKLVNDLRRVLVQRPDGTTETQLGPYIEPVQLQVVCERLWAKPRSNPNLIVENDIEEVDDVDGLLASYYSETVRTCALETDVRERLIREWFSRELITKQGIRGQVLQEENKSGSLDNNAIKYLIARHLVRAEAKRYATWYELTHDRFIKPVLSENDKWFQTNLSALQRQAVVWENQDRSDDFLLHDNALREAEVWEQSHVDELTPTEREFLEGSRKAQGLIERDRRQARRITNLARVVSLVSFLTLLALAYLFVLRREAEVQRYVSLSRALAAQAISVLDEQPDLALLLSLESNRIDNNLEARGSLLTGLSHTPQLSMFLREHTNGIRSVAITADGKTLASAGTDGTIILWNVESGRPKMPPLTGHSPEVWSLAFSKDGLLASGGCGKIEGQDCTQGEVRLWDAATGSSRGQIPAHEAAALSVAFSPNGRILASSGCGKVERKECRQGEVRLWDVATGKSLRHFLQGRAAVWSVAFSPDGTKLASGSVDRTIRLWNAAGQPISPLLRGHSDQVRSVAFSTDGRLLASGSRDNTIRLWNVASRRAIGEPLRGHTNTVTGVIFTNGKMLVSSSDDMTVRLWNVETKQLLGKPLSGHSGPVQSIAYSPNNNTLASGSLDRAVIMWNLGMHMRLGRELRRYGEGGRWTRSVAFSPSPDGQILAWASPRGTITLWNSMTGQIIRTLEGHTGPVLSLAFSGDKKTLATGSSDGTVRLWNVATGAGIGQPLRHQGSVWSVSFSPDGRTLASGSCGLIAGRRCIKGGLRLWIGDPATGQLTDASFVAHADLINVVAFSPDGKTLASASEDGTIILWDVSGRRPIEGPPLRHSGPVRAVAFTLTDMRGVPRILLASSSRDTTIILWDVEKRHIFKRIRGHAGPVLSVAFSPEGRTLFSGSLDNTVRLWDTASGRLIGRPLSGHTDAVRAVAVSSDGRSLASVGRDGRVVLWDVSFESWQARACKLAARSITEDELRIYLSGHRRPGQDICLNAGFRR